MIPHTLVLKPGLVVHSIYNGYWFWGRPSIVDLWHDLRDATREIRPDWDLGTPGLREAWEAGDFSAFHGWNKWDAGQAGRGREGDLRLSLRGRAGECAALDELVRDIRRGESRSLALRGEAGIGKTALLEYLVESASDLAVVRAAGVESEMELAFAGLQQLCAPMLDRLGALPAPQRQALEIVFGLSAGAAPDRFLVGLAVLSLFSEVADERPLLCVVDDAHWLDQASALTLAFVARRLLAEPVGLVFAAREPGEEIQHVPELEVRGLRDADARALLASAVVFMLDERVRDQIIAETRGNPLALLELPRGLTRDGAGRRVRDAWRARAAADGSRRASCDASPRSPRTCGFCCSSQRPSRSAIRCC